MNIHSEQNAHFFRIIKIISIMIDNFYNRRHTHANLNILLKDPSSKISFQSFLFSLLLLFNHSISIQSSQYIQAYDVSFDSTKKKVFIFFFIISFFFCLLYSFIRTITKMAIIIIIVLYYYFLFILELSWFFWFDLIWFLIFFFISAPYKKYFFLLFFFIVWCLSNFFYLLQWKNCMKRLASVHWKTCTHKDIVNRNISEKTGHFEENC